MQFTLVVNDFWVKYVDKEHVHHLRNTLEQHYTVTTKWEGTRYIGITFDWDYKRRQVHVTIPTYVKKNIEIISAQIKEKSETICIWTVFSPNLGQRRREIHSEGMCVFFMFGQGSGQHSIVPQQYNCIPISSTNGRHNATHGIVTRLIGNTVRVSTDVQRQRHETGSAQWFKLAKWTKSQEQSRWALLPIRKYHDTRNQWCSTQHCSHYQTCNVINHRSEIDGILYHGQGSCVDQNHIRGNGSQTATNTSTNRQFNDRRCVQWQNSTKMYHSNGHAIPLAGGQIMSETVQNILETRQVKLRRLLDVTSSSSTPQRSEVRSHYPKYSVGDATDWTRKRSSSSSGLESICEGVMIGQFMSPNHLLEHGKIPTSRTIQSNCNSS